MNARKLNVVVILIVVIGVLLTGCIKKGDLVVAKNTVDIFDYSSDVLPYPWVCTLEKGTIVQVTGIIGSADTSENLVITDGNNCSGGADASNFKKIN